MKLLVLVSLFSVTLSGRLTMDAALGTSEDTEGYGVEYSNADVAAELVTPLVPYYPTCLLKIPPKDGVDYGEIKITESHGTSTEWGCKVTNTGASDYVVRVMTTRYDTDGSLDLDLTGVYVVPAGKSIIANDGQGKFNKNDLSRCRLCGARRAHGHMSDKDAMELVKDIQCRRECYATLYKNQGFAGPSRTITSDQKAVTEIGGVSALKVGGEGCHLLAYDGPDFNGNACSFFAQNKDTAWDITALDACTKTKLKCSLKDGDNCIKSVRLYPAGWCLPSVPKQDVPPPSCPECAKPSDLSGSQTVQVGNSELKKLERLFESMAAVLESAQH